jgi:enoyl-CoA hydratase
MVDESVLYDVAANGVATITLNEPATRNALTAELLAELVTALRRAQRDSEVRCVVLASSHQTVFSAGGDLRAFSDGRPLVHKHLASESFVEIFSLLGELGKPSLCAVGGHALAGALGLALACDLVIARENASFGTPEIDVGLFPFMVMALMYRNIPRKKANELLLLGERLNAEQALQAGIVNRVVAAEEFDSAVSNWAQRLAAKSPIAMRLGKDAMYRQQDMAFPDALEYLRSQLTIVLSSEDMVEGVDAFFAQREPRWSSQ